MFADVPIDDVEMRHFAPLPTEGEFLAAITRTVREWTREKVEISQKSEIRMLLEHSEFGVEMFLYT